MSYREDRPRNMCNNLRLGFNYVMSCRPGQIKSYSPVSSWLSMNSFDMDGLDPQSRDFESRVQYQELSQFPCLRPSSQERVTSRVFPFSYTIYRKVKKPALLPPRLRPFQVLLLLALDATCVVFALIAFVAIFIPSYTNPPPHYASLRRAAFQSKVPGRGNPHQESVFIAASLYDRDGSLADGEWGRAVLELIDLLGKDNVFLSVYENDSGPAGKHALKILESQVTCNKSMVFDEHVDLKGLPSVIVPGGAERVKRIDYLAEVRNRALKPLYETSDKHYDKLLILNDVVFDPVDAVNLLFSTNISEEGKAQYRAACAVDFDNPFKFYDTFATRDLQGYSMGVPFFPWFSTAGNGESRKDVVSQKDAVRVRSCWGGMVAFDAKPFQDGESPARFRSGKDMFWEGSECCLIHADIQDPVPDVDSISDTGIYMNPYVRVAYDSSTLSWLRLSRRFERLYPFAQTLVNHIAGLPFLNLRRTEVAGQQVNQTVWERDGGSVSFRSVSRAADNDGFCFRRGLSVVVEHRGQGQKGWEHIPLPSS